MLCIGKRSRNFFDIKNTQNDQTKLKELMNRPHDMPISSGTLRDKIMGLISNDDDDDDASLIDNFQGNSIATVVFLTVYDNFIVLI